MYRISFSWSGAGASAYPAAEVLDDELAGGVWTTSGWNWIPYIFVAVDYRGVFGAAGDGYRAEAFGKVP
jgi:hypothetical protein